MRVPCGMDYPLCMDTGSIFIDNCPLFRGDGWYLLAGEALPSRLELRCGLVRHAATGQEVPGSQIAGRVVAVGVSLPPPRHTLENKVRIPPRSLRGLFFVRAAGMRLSLKTAAVALVWGRMGLFVGRAKRSLETL